MSVLVLLLLLGYGWLIAPRLSLPLLTDEVQFAAAYERPWAAAATVIPHPSAYVGLLRTLVNQGWAFGPTLRIVGVVSVALTLWLVTILAHRLTPGAGALASFLWAMHPMAIQGGLILDIDNTILTPAMTAFLVLLVTRPAVLSQRDRCWLGLGLAGCLWVKLSCAPFLLMAVALRAWGQRQWRQGVREAGWIALLGGTGFVGTWTVWCLVTGIAWPSIFVRAVAATVWGVQFETFAAPVELLNRIVRIGLWLNPWLLILLGLCVVWAWRHDRSSSWDWRCVAGFVVAMGLGYVLVRGPHFGFAKYHMPMLPAALALSAAAIVRMGRMAPPPLRVWRWGLVGLACLAWYWFSGDLLYAVNHTLRLSLITGTPRIPEALRDLLWQGVWYSLPGMAALGWAGLQKPLGVRGASLALMLLGLLLTSSLALDLKQRSAPYATTYCYGRSWEAYDDAVRWITQYRALNPSRHMVGPVDLLWSAGVPYHEQLQHSRSHVRETLRAASENPAVGCLIYGTMTENIETWRTLLHRPEFVRRMEDRFLRLPVGGGEYTVWAR